MTEISIESDGIVPPLPDPGDVEASQELTPDELRLLTPRAIDRIEWLTARALQLKKSRDNLILTMMRNDDRAALANEYRRRAEAEANTRRVALRGREEQLVAANHLLAEAMTYIPEPGDTVWGVAVADHARQLRDRIIAFAESLERKD